MLKALFDVKCLERHSALDLDWKEALKPTLLDTSVRSIHPQQAKIGVYNDSTIRNNMKSRNKLNLTLRITPLVRYCWESFVDIGHWVRREQLPLVVNFYSPGSGFYSNSHKLLNYLLVFNYVRVNVLCVWWVVVSLGLIIQARNTCIQYLYILGYDVY